MNTEWIYLNKGSNNKEYFNDRYTFEWRRDGLDTWERSGNAERGAWDRIRHAIQFNEYRCALKAVESKSIIKLDHRCVVRLAKSKGEYLPVAPGDYTVIGEKTYPSGASWALLIVPDGKMRQYLERHDGLLLHNTKAHVFNSNDADGKKNKYWVSVANISSIVCDAPFIFPKVTERTRAVVELDSGEKREGTIVGAHDDGDYTVSFGEACIPKSIATDGTFFTAKWFDDRDNDGVANKTYITPDAIFKLYEEQLFPTPPVAKYSHKDRMTKWFKRPGGDAFFKVNMYLPSTKNYLILNMYDQELDGTLELKAAAFESFEMVDCPPE